MIVSFWVNTEAEEQLLDVGLPFFNRGSQLNFEADLDETLIESLRADELIEFVGIDSEFLISLVVKDA